MALALAMSATEEVRAMDPTTVSALLLIHSALTCITAGRLTMWVNALDDADYRRRLRFATDRCIA
jgi:hypothetical protein